MFIIEMKKFLGSVVLIIIFSSITFAIEVGGHLTEDTTWSPDNNPYLVTENIHVESGVTLTILPGTEIKLSGATLTTWLNFSQNFWLYGGDSIAKMFWVDGRIIAEGTEQDSIIFTRMQNVPDYCWGNIYSPEQADMSVFKYCKFEHSAGMGIYIGRVAWYTLSFYNGMAVVQNCDILNYRGGLQVGSPNKYVEILNNKFSYDANLNSVILDSFISDLSISHNDENYKPALIAGNQFPNRGSISLSSINFVNNELSNTIGNGITCYSQSTPSYIYSNEFIDCRTGVDGSHEESSFYIKNNYFENGYEGVYINYAYAEIRDNHFENSKLTVSHSYLSKIINNRFSNNPEPTSNPAISGNVDIITNNIVNNCGVGLSGSGASQFSNNLFINNDSICSFLTDTNVIENEIIIGNNDIFLHTPSVNGNPIFRNCILDFELPEGCIDGGGNIWVDSLQAQSIFEDIQNGDFHLIEGSLAIDAGFNTPYYYPFDMDYNIRVWDGDSNGQTRIDIGPYEFGSPTLGGIEGYTYNPTNGESVDYVLIKINNHPEEFTFSDSIGNFEYKLPAGIYDVYAERVFYEDVIEYQIEVFDGQFTQVLISMFETVNVEEDTINPPVNNFNLTNYPNPFNPSTTISFSIPTLSNVELSIFNIKGQKVKNLYPSLCYPELVEGRGETKYSVVWNGTDENNKPVASGIYFYQLNIDNKSVANCKMLLLK